MLPLIIGIHPGTMMLAKPKHFEPRPRYSSKIGQHPVIVLTDPDVEGRVKVATISHKHPKSTPQYPTSKYNLPEHPVTGEGTIGVGEPKVIDHKLLRPANPPMVMGSGDFDMLLADIHENSL